MKRPGHRELCGGWRPDLRLLLTNGLAGSHGAGFIPWTHPGLGVTEASSQPLPSAREEVAWREGVAWRRRVPTFHSISLGLSWFVWFWGLCF